MSAAYILCVDDDPDIRSLLETILSQAGYTLKPTASAFQARGVLMRARPDLVILDRTLPDVDGVEFLKEIRAQESLRNVPVLLLTSHGSTAAKVEGFDSGGDDYLVKPFKVVELLARVKALLRRSQLPKMESRLLNAKGIEIDLDSRQVLVQSKKAKLSPKEFDLLVALFEKPGHVFTRQFLLDRVWGLGMGLRLNTKTVDVSIGRLRTALGAWSAHIVSVPGVGYQLDIES